MQMFPAGGSVGCTVRFRVQQQCLGEAPRMFIWLCSGLREF